MTTILQPTITGTARTARTVAAVRITRSELPLDGLLGRLERAAARLPHVLAVPVLLAHAAISAVAYR